MRRFQFTRWTGEVLFVNAPNMREAFVQLGYPSDPEDFSAHLWEPEGTVTNQQGDRLGKFEEVDAKRSKWNILNERNEINRAKVLKMDRELESLRNTSCNLHCSGCGVLLETEADFARHYVVKDERFLNLGECPAKL